MEWVPKCPLPLYIPNARCPTDAVGLEKPREKRLAIATCLKISLYNYGTITASVFFYVHLLFTN